MTPEERRAFVLGRLSEAHGPLTGSELAREAHVSRQVLVQDVALLRAQGADIVSTTRGYVLAAPAPRPRTLFKVFHDAGRVEEELTLVVDLGGTVEDTLVNHRTYGRLSAPLGVSSRQDVSHFLAELGRSRSRLLSEVTSGYHFHHVSAQTAATLDAIGRALDEHGLLAPLTSWERAQGIEVWEPPHDAPDASALR